MQLHRVEGLDEKVVAAGFDAPQAIGAIGLRRHDHDGDKARGALLLELAADLEARSARREKIDEDQIGWISRANLQHGFASLNERNMMTFARQQAFQETGADVVVVGYEYGCASNHSAARCKIQAARRVRTRLV